MQVAWLEPLWLPGGCHQRALPGGKLLWGPDCGEERPALAPLSLVTSAPVEAAGLFLSVSTMANDRITKVSHFRSPGGSCQSLGGTQLVASGWLPARLHWDEGCSQAKKHRLLSPWLWKPLVLCPGRVSMLLHPRKGAYRQDFVGNLAFQFSTSWLPHLWTENSFWASVFLLKEEGVLGPLEAPLPPRFSSYPSQS